MAEDTPQQDRTEAATPRRMQRAREEGRVPVSREIHNFVGLAAVTLVLVYAAGGTAQQLSTHLAIFLAHADAPGLTGAVALQMAGMAALGGAGPFVLAALLAGVAASLLQTGFLINGNGLQPDFSRISPRAGLRRLFGTDSLVEAAKSVTKVAVMAFA